MFKYLFKIDKNIKVNLILSPYILHQLILQKNINKVLFLPILIIVGIYLLVIENISSKDILISISSTITKSEYKMENHV